MSSSLPSIPLGCPSWKHDAIRIVEDLFPVTPEATWNDLLDLRGALLEAKEWDRVLNLFLACREKLELDHYLPFFRLRRLLSTSLRLQAGSPTSTPRDPDLAALLVRQPKSLADIKREIRRDWFEHDLDLSDPRSVRVTVVER
jgi:hypothetical protein